MKVRVGDLPEGARFRWRGGTWEVAERWPLGEGRMMVLGNRLDKPDEETFPHEERVKVRPRP